MKRSFAIITLIVFSLIALMAIGVIFGFKFALFIVMTIAIITLPRTHLISSTPFK